jgi:hypothetical protein
LEATPYEFGSCLHQTIWIWLKVNFISDDFKLYQIGLKHFARHACRRYCVTRGETPCSVGQNRVARFPDEVPERLARIARSRDLAPY